MKKFFQVLGLFLVLITVIIYRVPIQKQFMKWFIFNEKIVVEEKGEYYLNNSFDFVRQTTDFKVTNQKQLVDVIYTFLNNGWMEFGFYCDYKTCEEDINSLSENDYYTVLNNFVHPYNNYTNLYLSINSFGRVELKIDKTYSNNSIIKINQKIDEIMNTIIKPEMSEREKIKTFHDYILNNTVYDQAYITNNLNEVDNPSHNALGPLFEKTALCGGYTDVMAIFLNKLKIPNYKISTDNHIWNLVYIDNTWLHLDLTWDDPVTSSGKDIILDTFFLITTEQLTQLNTGFHNFDKTIFTEAN